MECLNDLIRNAQVDNVTVHLPFQPTITKACLNINGHHIIMSKEKEEKMKVRKNLFSNNLVAINWYKPPLQYKSNKVTKTNCRTGEFLSARGNPELLLAA